MMQVFILDYNLWCFDDDNWYNVRKLFDICTFLFQEYTFRYEKRHKSEDVLDEIFKIIYGAYIPRYRENGVTRFPLCMPDQYKTEDVVLSYCNYYINEKRHLAQWTKRPIPDWWR